MSTTGQFFTTYAIRDDNAHFMDSWLGRSLLCAENNAAVAARESDLLKDSCNAFDDRDIVALNPLDAEYFPADPSIRQLRSRP